MDDRRGRSLSPSRSTARANTARGHTARAKSASRNADHPLSTVRHAHHQVRLASSRGRKNKRRGNNPSPRRLAQQAHGSASSRDLRAAYSQQLSSRQLSSQQLSSRQLSSRQLSKPPVQVPASATPKMRDEEAPDIEYSNGDVYNGEWVAGEDEGQRVRHGIGVLRYGNDAVYTGRFKRDLRSGHGTLTYANGDEYSGAWAEDMKEGDGRFTWAELGTSYDGQFESGTMHGHGRYTFADGCVYEGRFENGVRGNGSGGARLLADGSPQLSDRHGPPTMPFDQTRPSKSRHTIQSSDNEPAFRPDLALKRDSTKTHIEQMLRLEEQIETFRLEAAANKPTGDAWDALVSP